MNGDWWRLTSGLEPVGRVRCEKDTVTVGNVFMDSMTGASQNLYCPQANGKTLNPFGLEAISSTKGKVHS